ncbi:MAG: Hsp20/alpha crystallin family protein [Desulfobacterales bacterium]|jgi:HSP20 family protein
MKLAKWYPFQEMEDMFDRYTRSLAWPRKGSQEIMETGDWAPRVDISETDDAFAIKAEIPEVKKDDVKVTIENGVLTIRGERKQEKEEKRKKFHRVERYYGIFTRSFTLPDSVNESKIEASFKDGMLYLQLPKMETPKTKAIEVKVKS